MHRSKFVFFVQGKSGKKKNFIFDTHFQSELNF